MFNSTKRFSGLLIVKALFFSACKTTETIPSGPISVGLHQSSRLGSEVVVRVDSIQDSRCPTNVYCIWAGLARVKLLLSSSIDSSAAWLALGAEPGPNPPKRPDSTNVMLNNAFYKVILRGVNPYPGTGTRGQQQTAIIQVTKI